jgi:hypothetical protein
MPVYGYLLREDFSSRESQMARRTVVMLTDDLDGSEATETVRFGLDGRDYEVDLSKKNAKSLSGRSQALRRGWPQDRWPANEPER